MRLPPLLLKLIIRSITADLLVLNAATRLDTYHEYRRLNLPKGTFV